MWTARAPMRVVLVHRQGDVRQQDDVRSLEFVFQLSPGPSWPEDINLVFIDREWASRGISLARDFINNQFVRFTVSFNVRDVRKGHHVCWLQLFSKEMSFTGDFKVFDEFFISPTPKIIADYYRWSDDGSVPYKVYHKQTTLIAAEHTMKKLTFSGVKSKTILCFSRHSLASGVQLLATDRQFRDSFGLRQYQHVQVGDGKVIPYGAYIYLESNFNDHRRLTFGVVIFIFSKLLRLEKNGKRQENGREGQSRECQACASEGEVISCSKCYWHLMCSPIGCLNCRYVAEVEEPPALVAAPAPAAVASAETRAVVALEAPQVSAAPEASAAEAHSIAVPPAPEAPPSALIASAPLEALAVPAFPSPIVDFDETSTRREQAHVSPAATPPSSPTLVPSLAPSSPAPISLAPTPNKRTVSDDPVISQAKQARHDDENTWDVDESVIALSPSRTAAAPSGLLFSEHFRDKFCDY